MKYIQIPAGLRELGKSDAIGQVCLKAAKNGQQWAESQDGPPPEYLASFGAERATVVVGNEQRAGAILFNDSELEWIFGGRSRSLYRAVSIIEGMSIE